MYGLELFLFGGLMGTEQYCVDRYGPSKSRTGV